MTILLYELFMQRLAQGGRRWLPVGICVVRRLPGLAILFDRAVACLARLSCSRLRSRGFGRGLRTFAPANRVSMVRRTKLRTVFLSSFRFMGPPVTHGVPGWWSYGQEISRQKRTSSTNCAVLRSTPAASRVAI